jgi:hypothetical protein
MSMGASRWSAPAVAAGTVAVLALSAATSCAGRVPATAEPTEQRVQLEPLGTETVTPTPTSTLTPTATSLPTSTPPAESARVAPAIDTAFEASCAVPRSADLVTFTLAAGMPDDLRTAWESTPQHQFTGEVVSADEAARVYRLRSTDSPAVEVDLAYGAAALPLEVGKRYAFTLWADTPAGPPSGRALRVDDEAGLLALIVSLRETEGAGLRVLGGDRAGHAVRQLATTCREGPIDACGYQLRAAPLEVARGDAWLTLNAGESGALAFDPPYVVQVSTSHHRFPVGDVPCTQPVDWVQSYRIQRQAAPPSPQP